MKAIIDIVAVTATISLLFAPAPASAGQPKGRLAILVEGRDPAADEEILRVIDSQLSDMDVTVEPIRVESIPTSVSGYGQEALIYNPGRFIAIAWISSAPNDRAVLFVTDESGERFLARKLDFSDPPAGRETAALVIRATCEALLAGIEISIALPQGPLLPDRHPAAPPDEVSPAKASDEGPARSAPIMSMSTGYRFQVRSGSSLEHGLETALGFHPIAWLEVRAGYTFSTPVEASRRGVATITVERHPIGLSMRAMWVGERLSLGGSVGLVADVAVQRTLAIVNHDGFSRSSRDLIWSTEPSLLLGFRLVQRLSLFLSGGVQVPLNPVRYVYEGPDGLEVVEKPWRAQPVLSIGLCADLVTKLRPK